jgi:non-ribosomal peptide synthetase component F
MVHEHAPLAVAQRASEVPADAPLFTSLLNYRHNKGPGSEPGAGGALGAGIRALFGTEGTNYPLVASVDDDGDRLGLTVAAVGGIDAEAVAGQLHTVLDGLVAALETALDGGPELPLGALDVLDDTERRQVLLEWNDTAGELPVGTLPELFAAQAARTPHAVAVVDGGIELTYAQLDARADGLAALLAAHGVGPERGAAVLMERSADLVVALLAVVKAGGFYVPLDARYPLAHRATRPPSWAAPCCW